MCDAVGWAMSLSGWVAMGLCENMEKLWEVMWVEMVVYKMHMDVI